MENKEIESCTGQRKVRKRAKEAGKENNTKSGMEVEERRNKK